MELKPGDRLLVVTCNYQLADKTEHNGDLEDRFAQIVSRLRPDVELAEHFVHGVDDRLRLVQLNMVT